MRRLLRKASQRFVAAPHRTPRCVLAVLHFKTINVFVAKFCLQTHNMVVFFRICPLDGSYTVNVDEADKSPGTGIKMYAAVEHLLLTSWNERLSYFSFVGPFLET